MYKLSVIFTNDVLFLLIIIVVSVLLIRFIYKSIKKERVNYFETVKSGKDGGEDIKKFINKRIETAGKKTVFSLFAVEIYEGETLNNNLGSVQLGNLKSEMLDRIKGLLPDYTRFFMEDYTIYMYIKDLSSPKQLEYLANLILEQTKKSFTLVGSLKIDVDVNICAITYPGSGKKTADFLHNLELAMITSKRMGLNTFKIYDKQLSNEQTEEYKYYIEIRDAIQNQDFTLFYQPIMNLKDNSIIGAESLLRWNHKKKGILRPDKFLSIMEQSGDIYWVGLWAFEQLIKHFQQLKVKFPDVKLMLTINLSSKQLLNPSLVNEFKRLLHKNRADAGDFCLEIVEFTMFKKVKTIQDNITRLKQMGFSIAIDNYGLESNISHLDDLPINVIKFNNNYFSKTDSFAQNIIETINKYAAEKNMMIIAEGIEDQNSLDNVNKLNITYGQGYHFFKPKSFEEFSASIKSNIAAHEQI